MARSRGEAIAEGLDLGYSRVMDYQERQAKAARQAKLDQQAEATLAETRQRQATKDQLAALDAQEGVLKEEGAGLAAATTPVAPEVQQDFARRVTGLRARKQQLLGSVSGYDMQAQQRAGAADLEALNSTGDLSKLRPGQLTRALTTSLNRNPADYVRPEGGMAPIEKASMNVLEGLQSNDMGRVLSGLNTIYAPELSKGVGQPGREGGNIVAKRIVSVVPDPRNQDPENPRVIPVLRVYVNSGKEFRGPLPPDVPEGSTGYYDAPLTENRSADPNDPVMSLGLNDQMDRITKHMHLVELLNSPEGRQKLREDAASGWNPDEYLQALRSVGAAPPKQNIETRVVPRDAVMVETVRDPSGKIVSERRIEGNQRQAAPGALEQFKASLDSAVASGVLTQEQADEQYRTALSAAARGGGKSSVTTARETPAEQAERLVKEGKFKTLAEARAFVTPTKASNEAAARARSELGGLKSAALGTAPDQPDAAVDFWAHAVIAGDKDWQVGLSRSKTGADLIEKVKRRVPEMARELGLEPQDIGTTRAQSAAYAAAMKELTKRAEGVELFASKVEKDMKTFDGLLDKAALDSPMLLNRPINALRRQFSDPALSQLDLAASQVGKEYERLINGGTLSVAQLHAGAAEDAKSLINGNMSPKQARAVMATMLQEMENARAAAKESTARIQEKMRGLGRSREEPGGAAPARLEPPAVGTVKGGYRFKGGNPADKANWEKT